MEEIKNQNPSDKRIEPVSKNDEAEITSDEKINTQKQDIAKVFHHFDLVIYPPAQ